MPCTCRKALACLEMNCTLPVTSSCSHGVYVTEQVEFLPIGDPQDVDSGGLNIKGWRLDIS